MDLLTIETAALVAICAGSALLATTFLTPRKATAQYMERPNPMAEPEGPVFLFDEQGMIDSSVNPQDLFGSDAQELNWQTFVEAVGATYPTLPASPDSLRDGDQLTVPARDGLAAGCILIDRIGGVTRIQLSANSLAPATSLAQDQSELSTLRIAMDAIPYPVWRIDAANRVIWHNAAYAALVRKVRGRDPDLERPLFAAEKDTPRPGQKARLWISPDGQDQKSWFDVTAAQDEAAQLYCAADINAVVDAEVAQRNFVQTLAKTFAQLSIGLAIFDRNRQLALFNPALIDLTALPADFLSARPTLLSFFDRLRDLRMMPEPKNYGSWRQQMADLVEAAADGRYQETWSLPSGSVYSVSGRPHPDGAVAFLFEDITAEITLTRRFRSELELGQSILDRLDDAIAVFSPDSVLVFSNDAFHALWGIDPDRSFAQVTVLDATRAWQDLCVPTPVWGEFRDFVNSRENRADWWAEVRMRSGEALLCNVHPIQNGSTLIRFGHRTEQHAVARPALADQGRTEPA